MGRRAKVLLGAAAGALTISLSACIGGGAAPSGSSGPGETSTETATPSGPVSTTRSDDAFELTISTPNAHVEAPDPIEIDTTLTYIGARSSPTISTSAGGPVAFSVDEIGGNRKSGSVRDSACRRGSMIRGVPVPQPFAKSGGWSNGDPNADFVRAYVRGPDLNLPPGRWRITAELVAYVGDCTANGAHELTASVEIVVR
ncbi:MAG TPA: hypothetical protein VGK63_11130 [Candidatus Limnocylindrales bacterium]